jgi:hypothetical protein
MRRQLLTLVIAAAVASGASAGAPSYRQICKDDYKKFCAGNLFNAAKCMRAHAAELSDACKAAWLAHEQATAAASNAAEPRGQ